MLAHDERVHAAGVDAEVVAQRRAEPPRVEHGPRPDDSLRRETRRSATSRGEDVDRVRRDEDDAVRVRVRDLGMISRKIAAFAGPGRGASRPGAGRSRRRRPSRPRPRSRRSRRPRCARAGERHRVVQVHRLAFGPFRVRVDQDDLGGEPLTGAGRTPRSRRRCRRPDDRDLGGASGDHPGSPAAARARSATACLRRLSRPRPPRRTTPCPGRSGRASLAGGVAPAPAWPWRRSIQTV